MVLVLLVVVVGGGGVAFNLAVISSFLPSAMKKRSRRRWREAAWPLKWGGRGGGGHLFVPWLFGEAEGNYERVMLLGVICAFFK